MTTPTSAGEILFPVSSAGKPCHTAYEIYGTLTPTCTPLILIHGGPGLSQYLRTLASLAPLLNTALIFYEQLGIGASTHLREKNGDESFWTEDLFINELLNLVSHFRLDESPGGYDVLGHSWGGMMGSNYAARRPQGLRKLVLSNSPATIVGWFDAYCSYREQLPKEVRSILMRDETETQEYMDALMQMFAVHMCTVIPFPDEFVACFQAAMDDPTVSSTMMGTNNFKVRGSLKNWSAAENCSKINVPTLVINGVEEGASDEAVAPFVKNIPDVKWVKMKESTHMPMYEEKENYLKVLVEFLKR